MEMKSSSQFVLITGVSTGIGFGVAKHLIARGYHVIGSVRNAADGDRVSAELGSKFSPLVFDVTDGAAVLRAAADCEKITKGQGLAGLINNAGIAKGGPLLHMPIEEIRENFEVNVIGMFRVTQAFAPQLGARKDHPSLPGRILNISSVGGKMAAPFIGPYVGTKHAVEGMSHSLRRELLPYGIDVIIIGPGSVQTPIWGKRPPADRYANTDYAKPLQNFLSYMEKEASEGLTIDEIGEQIASIFVNPKPKTRYALLKGKFTKWVLPRLFPDRMVDRLLGKGTGLLKS